MRRTILLVMMAAGAAWGADQAVLERGQKEAQRDCTPCHSLRLVQSQRLSRATWDKEITKMYGWLGKQPTDRQALLEYLVANYGNDKPAVKDPLSSNGVK